MLLLTDAGFRRAQAFVYVKWCERAFERGESIPADLSRSCKFGSLFVRMVYGGVIAGNYQHQFNVIDDLIVDLSNGASDVHAMRDPYLHEEGLFAIAEHMASMEICRPRAQAWADEFESAERAR